MDLLDRREGQAPSLKKQSSYLLIGKILSLFVKYLAPIVLVRILTQYEYGIYQQFHLVSLTFIPILSFGLGSSLFYFYPIADSKEKSLYIGQTYFFLLFIGTAFLVFYLFWGIQIHQFLGVEEINQFSAAVPVYVLFMLVSTISDQVYTIEKKIRYNLYFFPIDSFIRTLLLVLFAVYSSQVRGLISALLIYSILRFVFITLSVIGHLKETLRSLFELKLIEQIKYSLPLAGALIISTLNRRIDKLMINNYITAEEFAIYSVAFFSIPILNEAINAIQSVIVPELTSYYKNSKISKMADLWKRSVTIVASLNIPIIVYFFVIAEILFAVIYTEKYIESATYFRLFIIVYLSSIFLRGVILRASDKTKYLFYIDLFCFPLTIIFSYILIRQYGMVGAVLTAIIGEILPITIRLLIEVRLLNLRFIEWLEWNKLLLVLISSCAPLPFIYLLMNYLSNQYVILLFSGAFYFIGVIIIQYLLGIFMFEKELMAFRNTIFSKLGL